MSTPHHGNSRDRDDYSPTAPAVAEDDPYSIAALFKHAAFPSLAPNIFSFLSVIELMYIEAVNPQWHNSARVSRETVIRKLHLGQFWSRIGLIDTAHFTTLISKFHCITELNLGYCHFLTGDVLYALVQAIRNYPSLQKLNLFYCYQLQDTHLVTLTTMTPMLVELNIGRCIHLTDKTFRAVAANLPQLKTLHASLLPKLSEETLMVFDDTSLFLSLAQCNLINSGTFKEVDLDEVRASCATLRPSLKIVGPDEDLVSERENLAKKMRRQTQKNQQQDLNDN